MWTSFISFGLRWVYIKIMFKRVSVVVMMETEILGRSDVPSYLSRRTLNLEL